MPTIPEMMAFSPLGTSTNNQETAPKAKYDIVNQESSRSHKKMDFGPNSTSKTNSRAEHCPRPNKETNCHRTDRYGSGTTNIIAKNNTCKVVGKSVSEKKIGVGKVQQEAVKKCPSMPSLFFIGTSSAEENEGEEILKQEKYTNEKEEFGEITKQELFHKAEIFIGNFYKQLKIQREDSWKRLHDFYHNAAK